MASKNRHLFSTITTKSPHKNLHANATPQEREAFLHRANAEMQKYDETKRLLRQGKLPSKNPKSQQQSTAGVAQLTVVGLFLVSFLATPFVGKRIAQDEEFRAKWVPAWYDFTVKKPEKPWTRQELHEQMMAVEKDIRERAIAGEFTTEKLQELQRNLQGMDYPKRKEEAKEEPVPAGWTKVHPGLADGEKVNEDD